jgi:hypothetical protein
MNSQQHTSIQLESRQMKQTLITVVSLLVAPVCLLAQTPVGTQTLVGTLAAPKSVSRLEITKPGVYENYLVDAQGKGGNIVKITADNVIVRNCEIFNGSGNGIGVFGTHVVIENCRIHHLLKGTFKQQEDAHGITGRWGDVTIRNCDISHTSGDCIQFDPDRASQGNVLIENCHLWSGPLPADAGGFKAPARMRSMPKRSPQASAASSPCATATCMVSTSRHRS